jgi:uncharacterized protein YbbC (DUF1343 family)
VLDPTLYRPYRTSLILLQAVIGLHPERFGWKQPPYEYDFHNLPIDLILGSRSLRLALESMADLDELARGWEKECLAFGEISRGVRLYE